MEIIEIKYRKPKEKKTEFKSFRIPLIRRTYPPLIANKIVSVQPLMGPSGLVHYLRFRYSKTSQESIVPVPPTTNEVTDQQ